ncbi:helix-hairpin-helix domain-containing protein [Gracilibacillus kekensis]|uniref:Competence protein ComEA n=1 Tax=Gracilibacillus kekensis TaxID=1027249 RepID=A0A1M7P334_9BACI|nr:helix-hairpin-helix domain-containing protein [Gracilibacillus kekensis]SHN10925.1 competence protein ComEA [Gracilibacillus kekensis]
MTWLIKNWYILLLAIILIIWLLVEPAEDNVVPSLEETSIEDFQKDENEEVTAVEEVTNMVDIKGAVKMPGVYVVSESDRVKDAIEKAGGFLKNAEVQSLNLAERTYDEMVIYVPTVGETDVNSGIISSTAGDDKIKINIATAEEIQTIPGIGEVKAAEIVKYRETYGSFEKITDLTNVSGIGKKTVEKMEDYVRVP